MIRGRIAELGSGDLVEVTWLDACSFRNVRVFTKDVYITLKRTVGLFHAFLDDHLILLTEVADDKVFDGTSIPVGCIIRLEKLGAQEAMAPSKRAEKAVPSAPFKLISRPLKVTEEVMIDDE